MNKIFKVVWSKVRKCYVVVSEYGRSSHKKSSVMKVQPEKMVLAGLLTCTLSFGLSSGASAYTYDNVNTSLNTVKNDETDFVAKNGSNLTVNGNFSPDVGITNNTPQYTVNETYNFYGNMGIRNLPTGIPASFANQIINAIKTKTWNQLNTEYPGLAIRVSNISSSRNENFKSNGHDYSVEEAKQFNYENLSDSQRQALDSWLDNVITNDDLAYNSSNGQWYSKKLGYSVGWNDKDFVGGEDEWNISLSEFSRTGDSTITLDNSKVTGKANSETAKDVKVNNNSTLSVAGNTNYGSLSASNSNVTVGGNATIANGVTTTGNSKVDVSNGTLTITKGPLKIAEGGVLKAKVLKAAATGETSEIGSNTKIDGSLTTTGDSDIQGNSHVGKDLTVDGTSTLTGDVTTGGNTTVGKNLDVKGNSTIEGDTETKGNSTVDGTSHLVGDVTMDGNASIGKDLTVDGNTTTKGNSYTEGDSQTMGNQSVEKNLTVKGDSDLQGNATVGRDLDVKGDTTLEGALKALADAEFGKDVTVKGDTDLQGMAHVGKDLTVDGNSHVKGDQTVDGASHLVGDVAMDGNATVGKDLTVNGSTNLKDTRVDGTFEVTGKATFDGDTETKGNATVDGDSIIKGNGDTKGNQHIGKDLTVDGNSNLKGDVTMGGNTTIEKDLNVAGNTDIQGDAHVHKDLTVDGNLNLKSGSVKGENGNFSGDIKADGSASIGKDLTVEGKSDLKGDVLAESNLTVGKDAEIGKNLHVKGTSQLDGATTVGTEDAPTSFTVHGTTNLHGDTVIGSEGAPADLIVHGGTNIKKDMLVEGSTGIVHDLEVGGNANIHGNQTVDGDGHYKGSLTVDKNLTVNGSVFTSGDSGTQGNYTVGKDLNVRGDAHVDGKIVAEDAILGGKSMNSEMAKMNDRISGVGAGAAALAALQYDNSDSRWQIAAGVGSYKSKNATALGARYHFTDRISAHVGATLGTDDRMVNGGITFALGPSVKRSLTDEDKAEIKQLKDDNNALKKMVMQLTNRINALLPDDSKRSSFPDVPKGHWANKAVETLKGNGVVEGYPNGKFEGEKTMTRYEYAKMLYEALEKGKKVDQDVVDEYSEELMKIQKEYEPYIR